MALTEWDIPSGGGGGSAPAIFYAQAANTNNLGTSLATIDWGTPLIADAGYTENAGTVTIGAALNGKVARVDWAVTGTGATNRVEINSELQVNATPVASCANYSARNGSQDTGGVTGFHYLTLTTGMQLRIQALRVGSNANKIIIGTCMSIETKS